MPHSEERSIKRRRLETAPSAEQNGFSTAGQLQQSLRFKQTITPDVKTSINRFKDFLSNISRTEDLVTRARNFEILRQYCNNQLASTRDDLDFPDLISTWSYAAQHGNDSICSAIPAVLAQFYRTISGYLELRDFGLSLGHTLLKRDQVRLFDRGLSVSRTKEHLISPCLRLLTEIVSFDGGTLAARVFSQRDVLFKRLEFLLDQRTSDVEDDRRKPSVRRMAQRLVIANLKFLDGPSKAELIMHGRILRNCLRGMMLDGDDIVVDILRSIDVGLIDEKEISRATKGRIFNQDNLSSLALLYDYEPDDKHTDSLVSVRNAVHELLLKLCSTRKGILLPQNGWYPVAYENTIEMPSDDRYINLGFSATLSTHDYSTHIPVKNMTLSTFAENLKPESDTMQSTLLLQILRAAPELVADYFNKKTKISASSSDDPSWRNYFAFLFSIPQLPVPRHFGWQDEAVPGPPPVSVVVESILPRPFDRNTLSKYLTSSEDIMALSAARLLIVSLRKLQNVLKLYEESTSSDVWQQASTGLVEAILQRVPKLQEVKNCLQRTENSNETLRLALFECLAIYHKVLPEATTDSKFDIGPILSDTLSQIKASHASNLQHNLEEQILHLVTVAQLSDATKWWTKSDNETMSLFSQLLQFATTLKDSINASEILVILKSVAGFAGLLHNGNSFTALLKSLTSDKKFAAVYETWLVLDNAVVRGVQRPVKYLDRIESVQYAVSDAKPISILAAAVAEQWEFVLKKHADSKEILKNIADWISRFYTALNSTEENFRTLEQFQEDMLSHTEGKAKAILQKALSKTRKLPAADDLATPEKSQVPQPGPTARSLNLDEILGKLTSDSITLEGADRWDEKTDIELSIETGKMARLFRCTSSTEDEIRRQASQSLQNLLHVIEQSTHEEKTQLHLLIGELSQTVRQQTTDAPLPSIASELAVRLLEIIVSPAHAMYGKANKFLLRSPSWDLKRLISYWIREILFQEPESDSPGSWNNELEWFLQLLVDGLKIGADMEIYRRSGVFEKTLVIYTKPDLFQTSRRLVLSLIWRGICVGGADTLITRTGVLSWLELMSTFDKDHSNIINQLSKAVGDACDSERIRLWKEDLPALRDKKT